MNPLHLNDKSSTALLGSHVDPHDTGEPPLSLSLGDIRVLEAARDKAESKANSHTRRGKFLSKSLSKFTALTEGLPKPVRRAVRVASRGVTVPILAIASNDLNKARDYRHKQQTVQAQIDGTAVPPRQRTTSFKERWGEQKKNKQDAEKEAAAKAARLAAAENFAIEASVSPAKPVEKDVTE